MSRVQTFSFVIPCFNKQDNVAATVGSVREAMDARADYEIILVNDASSDHTMERMQALAAADPHISVLDNPVNLSFGGSNKRGARGRNRDLCHDAHLLVEVGVFCRLRLLQ
jgi:glycosyltransferase involved in cell wall biosynthesis